MQRSLQWILCSILFYQPKYLATKNHSQGTKVRGESGQSPVEVVGGTEMPSINCSFLSQSVVNPIIQVVDSPSHFSVVWHALLYVFWQHMYPTNCIFWPNIKWFTFSDGEMGNGEGWKQTSKRLALVNTSFMPGVHRPKEVAYLALPFTYHPLLPCPQNEDNSISFLPFWFRNLSQRKGWQLGNNYLVTFFKAKALDRNTFLFLLIPDSLLPKFLWESSERVECLEVSLAPCFWRAR